MHRTCDMSSNMKNTTVHHPQNKATVKWMGWGELIVQWVLNIQIWVTFCTKLIMSAYNTPDYARTIQQLWHISLDTSECQSYCNMNQQADADVCAKHINHCAMYVNIKYLPQTFILYVPVSNGLHPAHLITKYITQWEKYGLHLCIGHWLVNSGQVNLTVFPLHLPVHNVQHVKWQKRGRDTISHVSSELI